MKRILFLDTETTGLSPINNRIISIGIVEAIDNKITGNNFYELINPEQKIPPAAYKIHGISDDMVYKQ